MSKLKKVLLMCTAYVLVAALAIGGTIAYLQDSDSDVNVMTLGNVKIQQIEQQRVDDKDNQTILEKFENYKPLYPAVFEGSSINWAPENEWVNAGDQAWKVVADNANVVDKFVTVKNTGKSDAYVRTLIAYEGNEEYGPKGAYIHIVTNGSNVDPQMPNNFVGYITVDKVEYTVFEYVYPVALAADETSIPSLKQVYMNKAADNDVVSYYGDTYDILVISQAVQSKGFNDAQTALDTGFGDVTEEKAAEWFKGVVDEHSVDTWDGTADTSWYDPSNPLTEYTISSAEQLAGLAELVSDNTTFDGVIFTLTKNLDLFCEDTTPAADGDPLTFRPIGDKSKNGTFEGTFDGNGKTISNLYQNGWDLGYKWGIYGSYGLFGNLNDATIKNLTLSGGESYIEGGDVSFVAGSATGTCVFENITIEDSIAATYNNGCGGIIGWSGAGSYTFKNITIAEDTVLAGLWGSFDSSIGGVVGQGEPGATYNFENVDIACRIDAYNDCTASYDYYNYRMCGMIIGRLEETTTIDGANYPDTSKYNITCKNVTVTYGNWANYHYCEPTPGHNNGRGMRVEPGYSYSGLPADYDHSQCIDHHMNLIPFDQIFGGDQYAVKGLPSYDGVNVIYNNK